MLLQVIADHLALHVAGLGSVGADEASVGVLLQNRQLGALVTDSTVEENDGDAVGDLQDLLSNVGSTGGNHVHNQQVGAAGDSGTDLVQLLSLVTAGVLVVVGHAQSFQFSVQSGTHGAEIDIRLFVPEYGYLGVGAALGGLAAVGSLGGLAAVGRSAGSEGQHHYQGEKHCNNLLHVLFSSLAFVADAQYQP